MESTWFSPLCCAHVTPSSTTSTAGDGARWVPWSRPGALARTQVDLTPHSVSLLLSCQAGFRRETVSLYDRLLAQWVSPCAVDAAWASHGTAAQSARLCHLTSGRSSNSRWFQRDRSTGTPALRPPRKAACERCNHLVAHPTLGGSCYVPGYGTQDPRSLRCALSTCSLAGHC
jgi:hypothetical protein